MNYGNIKECDIADGPGVRVSLFVSGCRHHCKGCFNSETWDFQYGVPFTEETQDKILELLKPGYIQGFTLLGGEKIYGVTVDIYWIRICSPLVLCIQNIQKRC